MATLRSVAAKVVTRRSLLCLAPVLAVAAAVTATASASAGAALTLTAAPECAADLIGR
jgi:hypothetical protein